MALHYILYSPDGQGQWIKSSPPTLPTSDNQWSHRHFWDDSTGEIGRLTYSSASGGWDLPLIYQKPFKCLDLHQLSGGTRPGGSEFSIDIADFYYNYSAFDGVLPEDIKLGFYANVQVNNTRLDGECMFQNSGTITNIEEFVDSCVGVNPVNVSGYELWEQLDQFYKIGGVYTPGDYDIRNFKSIKNSIFHSGVYDIDAKGKLSVINSALALQTRVQALNVPITPHNNWYRTVLSSYETIYNGITYTIWNVGLQSYYVNDDEQLDSFISGSCVTSAGHFRYRQLQINESKITLEGKQDYANFYAVGHLVTDNWEGTISLHNTQNDFSSYGKECFSSLYLYDAKIAFFRVEADNPHHVVDVTFKGGGMVRAQPLWITTNSNHTTNKIHVKFENCTFADVPLKIEVRVSYNDKSFTFTPYPPAYEGKVADFQSKILKIDGIKFDPNDQQPGQSWSYYQGYWTCTWSWFNVGTIDLAKYGIPTNVMTVKGLLDVEEVGDPASSFIRPDNTYGAPLFDGDLTAGLVTNNDAKKVVVVDPQNDQGGFCNPNL